MTRVYWLSFVDERKPKGQRFLGVSIVAVNDGDMQKMLELKPGTADRDEEVKWLATALNAAWRRGCNPGGQVGSMRIDDRGGFERAKTKLIYDTLLSKPEIEAMEAKIVER